MSGSARTSSLRELIAPGLATIVAFAILISLGIWQLERKAWKEGLLSAIAARAYGAPGAPVGEPEWPVWTPASDEFRKIQVTGTFLDDLEVPVHGLAEERRGQALQGFYLFTPLRRAGGSVVIVNRGFVPTELRDPVRRATRHDAGRATVTGLVRNPEERALFVPRNDLARNEWFVRDLRDMARAKNLERVAPFYIDADATPNPGGWPRGGQTRMDLPNDHLNYALTWFGLAATLVGVFSAFAWRRLQGARAGGTDHHGAAAGSLQS